MKSSQRVLIINLLLSLIIYPFILSPLSVYTNTSIAIFPVAILVQNIILWSSVIYLEKISLR